MKHVNFKLKSKTGRALTVALAMALSSTAVFAEGPSNEGSDGKSAMGTNVGTTALDPVSMAAMRHSGLNLPVPSSAAARRNAPSSATKFNAPSLGQFIPSRAQSADAMIFEESSKPLALVRLEDGFSAEDLVKEGFEARPLRGGFAVVSCEDITMAERLASHRAVKRCEINRRRYPTMELARRDTGVEAVHAGESLPEGFSGKGVVTGIVDGGFDPNHINFKDADGNTRFKYFSTVEINTLGDGIRVTPYTPEQLSRFTTDDYSATHGTHTLGIMSGGYRGELLYGNYDHELDKVNVTEGPNPFYGVAPEATIYASSGASYDALIAYAIDGILEHRWYNDHDAPIVINLSLGGNNGPHDGNGMLCQYIDAVSESDGAIFCIAAGNEGDIPIAYHKTFTEDDTEFSTFIRPYVYNNVRYGMVEIYSDTDEDFDVSVIVYNKGRGRVARTFPLTNKDGGIQYIISGSEYSMDESDIVDATFAKAYDGYVGVGGRMDPDSNRFYAAVDYYVINAINNQPDPDTTEAQYTLGFLVKGKPGQRIDCFCDGAFTALDSYGIEGYVDGMVNGTISDVATARSAIAVGSYNTREWGANLDGNLLGYDGYYRMDEVTEFSSFGSTVDGRDLPHVLAPGCTVVSSVSTPYVNAGGADIMTMSALYEENSRPHYFTPMMGTSMASPFVAGTVALMLEANPDLDSQGVRDILMQTARRDWAIEMVNDPVQCGAGKIDAHAAVIESLRRTSALPLIGADKEQAHVVVTPSGNGCWRIFVEDAPYVNIEVYTIDGRHVLTQTNPNRDEAMIDLSTLTKGIYVVAVNGSYFQRFAN